MTKKKLLEILDNSILKSDVSTQDIYNKYVPLIKATLISIKDDESIIDMNVINDCMNDMDTFDNFVRNSAKEKIELKLAVVVETLSAWIKFTDNVAADMSKNNAVVKIMSENNKGQKERQKKNHIRSVVLISLFVAFSLAVFIFALLDEFKIVDYGGVISGVCGILDFFNGVMFFIFERVDDSKKKVEYNEIENATKTNDFTELAKKYNITLVNTQKTIVNAPTETHGANSPVQIGENNTYTCTTEDTSTGTTEDTNKH